MLPTNTLNIYCPGCSPGDFPQPHSCGAGLSTSLTSGYCGLCNVYWTGSHACFKAQPVAAPNTTTILPRIESGPPSPAPSHEHCWCLKQKAGNYRIPDLTSPFGSELRHLKPHKVCCNCGARRLKA